MGNFYTDTIQTDERYHSITAIHDVALLEPGFRTQVAAIVDEAKAANVVLQVLETYRSQELQQIYYDRHVTQLKTVGVHHYGLSCDFGVVIGGKINWDAGAYKVVGTLSEKRGLIWGGRFPFGDFGHVQGIAVADQPKLFSGAWYPPPPQMQTAAAPAASPAASVPAVEVALHPATDVPPPGGLTQPQQVALNAIDQVNVQFSGWFRRAALMAFCQIESSFNPTAFRQEPSGVASYGLMQVLDVTARGLGFTGTLDDLYDPATGILWGATYAAHGWDILVKKLQRSPTLW